MEKQQILYVPGGDSYSNREDFLHALRTREIRDPLGNRTLSWKDTLVEELGEGYEVYKLLMPNRENASYDEWEIEFEKYLDLVGNSLVLIGMSLGGMFLPKYLISHPELFARIKHVFLLAGPCAAYDDGAGNDCGSFQFLESDLEKLHSLGDKITIMHSKDDFVVPYEHALKYKAALPEAELVTFEDKNHFLMEEFPELIEKIKSLSKTN